MRIQQQTNVTPYYPGGTVIVNFPLGVTYEQIKVQLLGGLTAEQIDLATLKVNGKPVFTVRGTDLKTENLYDGKANDDVTVWLDFTQQNAKSSSAAGKPTSQAAEMLVACYPSNLFQSMTLELTIDAGAPAAGTGGVAVYTTENDPSGNQFILKQLYAQYNFQIAQDNDIALPVGNSGGIIKQLFFHQTNYGAGGAGSISKVQVRNAGVVIMEATPAQLATVQDQYGKVQQNGLLVLDYYLQGLREKLLNTTKSNNVFVRLTTTGGPVTLTGYTRLLDPAGR
jgi:hypothetical protein